jgi:hypothetical protein
VASGIATYKDNTAITGTTYYYTIRAYDGTNESTNTAQASATSRDDLAPPSVTGLDAVPGNAEVTVSWVNPASPDWAGTLVRVKIGSYPASYSDPTSSLVSPGPEAVSQIQGLPMEWIISMLYLHLTSQGIILP